MKLWLTVNQGGTADNLRSLCLWGSEFFLFFQKTWSHECCSQWASYAIVHHVDTPDRQIVIFDYRKGDENGRQEISRSYYIYGS